jgi:integrase
MGSKFLRGNKIWLKYKSVSGRWVNKPSGLDKGQEKQADALLRKIEANVCARIEAGETEEDGPLTVAKYGERWLASREARELTSASEDKGRMRLYVKETPFGTMRVDQVRPRHVRDLIRTLRERTGEEKLAPRTVRNVYGMLHTMFHDAVVDELIATNPCVLHRGELPEKVDADPHWRSSAVFAREEVEALISDERIPEDRRVVYTILFLSGVRWGECAALRWKHYDADTQPLGRLRVGESYSVKLRRVKSVKTNVPREVPVHPLLAEVLEEWRDGGWQELMGREPTPEDLIVPARPVGQRSLDGGLDYAAMLEASPGLTQAELARRLGVTPAAISQRLAKPKRVLRDHGGFRSPSAASHD